jgi:hypothetical protein
LQNTDEFAAIETLRGQLVDDPLTDPQKEAGTEIGRKLFLMNRRALRARYGNGDFLALPKFVFEKWCDATPLSSSQPCAACFTSAAKAESRTTGSIAS